MRSTRRTFVTGLAACLAPGTLQARIEQPTDLGVMGPEGGFSVHELHFDHTRRSMQRTRVYVPHELTSDRKWPVAVLLHGYAQALTDERALVAWRAEYAMLESYRALQLGQVDATPALDGQRAQQINQQLSTRPFQGMVLVTPVTPIPYFQRDLGHTLKQYTEWMHQELLPAVAQVAPIATEPAQIGLAGVSMGGLVGLELMWRFPEQFGAYCGIQIAIKRSQVYRYAWLLQRAFAQVGQARPIRVVTATRDTYRWSNQAFYKALQRQKLDASLELREGAHTSRWMRQAGSLESLLWLDRTLNQNAPPPTQVQTSQGPALDANEGL